MIQHIIHIRCANLIYFAITPIFLQLGRCIGIAESRGHPQIIPVPAIPCLRKHFKRRYDIKGERQIRQEHATAQGESLNSFVRRAVNKAME